MIVKRVPAPVPPSPPPTFDITGLTFEEASKLRSLLGATREVVPYLYCKLGDVLGFKGGVSEYSVHTTDRGTIFLKKKSYPCFP